MKQSIYSFFSLQPDEIQTMCHQDSAKIAQLQNTLHELMNELNLQRAKLDSETAEKTKLQTLLTQRTRAMREAQAHVEELQRQLNEIPKQSMHTSAPQTIVGNTSRIIPMLAASGDLLLGLCADGTVITAGRNLEGRCNVSEWKEICFVAAGGHHTVGLRSDGTVIAAGENDKGQCNTSEWNRITAIAAGGSRTLGLRNDGTVLDTRNAAVSWRDIKAIAAGHSVAYGLHKNGTVLTAGKDAFGEASVLSWRNIVSISACDFNVAGVQENGKLVMAGMNTHKFKKALEWNNLISAAISDFYIIGMHKDKTFSIIYALNEQKSFNESKIISEWRGITSIASDSFAVYGLCENGTIVSTSFAFHPEVKNWNLNKT